MDNSALHGGAGCAQGTALHGGLGRSDLPIDTVKRLTCDGSLITIVEDEDGTPLDVGRKRRTVTTALKRALWSRDRHCTFPGCHNRCYVDAHHIEHWAEGGETSLENLTLLCTFHHTLLHEGGFKIRRDGDGALYFQRPDGRVIPRFGYRLDDMRDEYVVAESPSMEVREPLAVREASGVYYLRLPIEGDPPKNYGRHRMGRSTESRSSYEERRSARPSSHRRGNRIILTAR